MAGTRSADRIDRNPGVAVGSVFKPDRAGEGRGHFTVDLAFGGPCANRAPADQIGDKLAGHHIEELGCRGNAQLVHLQKQLTRQLNPVVNAIAAVEIGV